MNYIIKNIHFLYYYINHNNLIREIDYLVWQHPDYDVFFNDKPNLSNMFSGFKKEYLKINGLI